MIPTYHDIYLESVTKRKSNPAGKASFFISVAMAVFMFLLGLIYPGAYLLCFIFAGLAFWTNQYSEREYEVSYTNGTLDIDVIYSKSKRKSVVSVESEDIVVMAKSKTEPVQPYIGAKMKTYDCISHMEGVTYYCLIYRNKDTKEEEKVLFEPGDEILDELWRHAPQKIHK